MVGAKSHAFQPEPTSKMSIQRNLSRAGAAAATLVLLAACGDSTGPRSARQVSVSFASNAPVLAAAGIAADVLVSDGTNSIVITSVQLVMKEVELQTQAQDDACDSSGPGTACNHDEVEMGPFLVDLPLTGGTQSAMSMAIPAGTYHEIEFKLDAPDDDSAADRTFRAAHPDFNNISVKVTGTYNGAPFTYTARVEAELEMEFSQGMTIAEGSNVTVNVDVSRWFRNGSTVIDPRTAGSGGQNESIVRSNIVASFEAFEDDDRDGDDDNIVSR